MTSEPAQLTCPRCQAALPSPPRPNYCPRCGNPVNPHLQRIAEALLATDASWIRLRIDSGCRIIALAAILAALLLPPTILWRPFHPTTPWRAFAFLGLATLWIITALIFAKGLWRLTTTSPALRHALAPRATLIPFARITLIIALLTWFALLPISVWQEYFDPEGHALAQRLAADAPRPLRALALLATAATLAAAWLHRRRLDAITGLRDPSLWSWPLLSGVAVLAIGSLAFIRVNHPLTDAVIAGAAVAAAAWYAAWFSRAARRPLGLSPFPPIR